MARKRIPNTQSQPAPSGLAATKPRTSPRRDQGANGRAFTSSPLWVKSWPYLLLAALTVLFFWDSFLAGKAFLMRDTFCDCFPWRLFTRQALRAGHIPFWNPYSVCGEPYIANPQSAVFYPLHLVYYLLPPLFALKLWLALHLFLGAAGMFALGRHWKLEIGPALLAGISYGFSAFLVSMLEFQAAMAALALSPFCVLLVSRLIDAAGAAPDTRWRPAGALRQLLPLAVAIALLYTVIFLAGHQQSLLTSLFIVFIYLAARCLKGWDAVRTARSLAAFGAAGLLAIGLCLPQLLMTLQLLPFSIRSGTIDPGLDAASFHPVWFLTWLLPFLPGRPGHQWQWWGDERGIFEFWAGAVYIGILPLIFALMALLRARRRPEEPAAEGRLTQRFLVLVFLGIFAFGMLMSLGKYTPLYMFFYHHVPVFDKLRWPTKFLQLVQFATSALAGLGFQAFLDREREETQGARFRPQRWMLAGWLGLFAVMAAGTLWVGSHPGFFTWLTAGAYQHNPEVPARLAGLVSDWETAALFLGLSLAVLFPYVRGWVGERRRLAAQLAVVLVAFVNLMVIGRQIHPIAPDKIYLDKPDDALLEALQQEPCRVGSQYMSTMQYVMYGVNDPEVFRFAAMNLVGELGLPYGVFRFNGGDVLQSAALERFMAPLYGNEPFGFKKERTLALLNLRYFLQGPPLEAIINDRFPEELDVKEIRSCLPRALVAPNWRVVNDTTETLKILRSEAHDPYRTVLLDRAPEGQPAENMATPPAPNQPLSHLAEVDVESVNYGWNRVEVAAAPVGRPSILLLNEMDYPGWQASLDGRRVPILRGNMLFRAVALPPGKHTVTFIFTPTRFYLGLCGSLITLLLVAGLGVWLPVRIKRRQAALLQN